MPKETIHPRRNGSDNAPAPLVSVGWSREAGHVQIGVAPQPSPECDTGLTVVRTIADAVRDDLAYVDKHRGEGNARWTTESNYAAELDTILMVHERGWFADLDRDGINSLIRTLRKARDAAFGADA